MKLIFHLNSFNALKIYKRFQSLQMREMKMKPNASIITWFRSYKKTTKSELINQVFFYLRFWWPTLALGCLWCNCDRISCLIVSLWSCGYPELPWKLCQPLSKLRKFGWWYWCWAGTKAYCCCTICEKRTVGLHGTCEL